MKQCTFRYKNSSVGYNLSGFGERVLLCFHGYAEDASAFDFLEKHIGHQYTIYALDLPFHGRTDWKEGYNFSSHDLLQQVEGILAENNSKPAAGEKITVMGFSLGGRMVLDLFLSGPGNIGNMVLLAPDGLKVNFWYWLSTQTRLGNRFFAFTMKNPRWFLGFLKLLDRMKLVNASIFKFVNFYIGNKEVRKLLYCRWTTLRKIRPRIAQVKSLIRTHATPVQLLYGRHDRIILSSVGEKFRKGIEEHCILSVIASGHQVLHEKHVEDIIRCLTLKV